MSTTELDRNADAGRSEAAAGESNSRSGRRYFFLAAGVVCLLTLAVFFRYFLNSGFNLVAGDRGDNRFNMLILEHLRAVAHGEARFRSPNFYWPQRGVLGYSDSLFLYSLPYIIGRASGMDPYLAFQATLIVLKAIGFFSMLWLLRSFLGVDRSVAIVGSVLFTLSNLYFLSVGHAQLVTVVFVPLLAGLACACWRAYGEGQKSLGFVFGGLLGILLALVLFTSFYIGWFATLAAGLVAVSALLITVVRTQSLSPLRQWVRALAYRGPLLAVALLSFSVAIIPFLMTYLPTLKQTGGRTFQEDLMYSSHPWDLINVGGSNWAWGHPLNAVMVKLAHRQMVPGENQRGWPPLTLALIAAGLFLGLSRQDVRGRVGAALGKNRFPIAVLSVAFVTGWVLSVDVDGRSLWWLVFEFIPGGSAIRAPARFNLVLNILVVALACLLLDALNKRAGRGGRVVFWALSLLLVAEQINTDSVFGIQRNSENALLKRVRRPPAGCVSFFLSNPEKGGRIDPYNQVDAMLVARMNNLPTLNGYSGWSPPDWHLDTFDRGYLRYVRQWALANNISAGLCGLDLQEGSWTRIDFGKVPYLLRSVIDFHTGGNALLYEADGWNSLEEGGAWALGGHSSLLLNLPAPPTTDLLLTLRAHAFTPSQRPSFKETLRVNGSVVAVWPIKGTQIEERALIPQSLARSGPLRLEFLNDDPRSPAELGVSPDSRKLGLSFETIKIMPVASQAPYLLGSTIDFQFGGDAFLYETQGWGPDEEGGSWTLGDRSVLLLKLAAPPTDDLLLTFSAHAFLAPERPKFHETLRVNNGVVADWFVTETQVEKSVRVPRGLVRSGVLRIEFLDNDPKSPAELGISVDDRKLGLAMENLKLDTAGSHH